MTDHEAAQREAPDVRVLKSLFGFSPDYDIDGWAGGLNGSIHDIAASESRDEAQKHLATASMKLNGLTTAVNLRLRSLQVLCADAHSTLEWLQSEGEIDNTSDDLIERLRAARTSPAAPRAPAEDGAT